MNVMMSVVVVLVVLCSSVEAVVSPLDKVTQDMQAMKETLDSIQASLVTSVSLLQDQLTEFTSRTTISLDSRLSSLDSKVGSLESSLKDLVVRAHAWDSFQHHIQAWNSQLTSLDQKVDLMTRTQNGRLTEQGNRIKLIPDLDFKLDGLGRKLGELGGQVQVLDGRMLRLQDKLGEKSNSTLTALNQVVEEVRNNSRGHSGGHHKSGGRHSGGEHHSSCRENRVLLEELQGKTVEILERVNQVQGHGEPSFSYLRAPQQVGLYSSEEDEQEDDIEDGDFVEAEDKFVALFRRIATPFKRVNKRLSTMGAMMSDIQTNIHNSHSDMRRELSDFLESSTDQRQEQTHMLEGQAASLASLQQSCTGQAMDQARFSAQAGPVLDRLDRWMTSWQNSVIQQFERVLQQNSYDHDSHSKGHKELERLLMDGFERCKPGMRIRPRTTTERVMVTREPVTSTVRLPATEEVLREEVLVKMPLVGEEPEEPGVRGCEDLVRGSSGVRRVGEEEGYHTRYCHQGTSGAGWTVIQRRGDFGKERENFTRSWEEYSRGFGDLEGEFWWGNEHLSRLTTEQPMVLRVELEAHDGQTAHAEYSTFRVDGEEMAYQLWVGGYTGNASDSFSAHNGFKFSTVDKNNDEAPTCCPCAPAYGGGWWFYSCFESNLNGEYFGPGDDNGYYRGIIWELWLGDYSLKSVAMMVRPQDLAQTSLAPLAGLPPDP